MVSPFSTLAVELIELIASSLERPDLFALRLVSKDLNLKTPNYFSRTCLTKLWTDLSCNSLHNLKEISAHEEFRHQVQTLSIEGQNDIGLGFMWNRHSSGHLVAPLRGRDELRNILLDLVNCRSFHIHCDHEREDVYEPEQLTNDVVAIILSIVAETALPVVSFRVESRKSPPSKTYAVRLPSLRYREPGFMVGLAHLRDLYLEYDVIFVNNTDWAAELIVRASNL